MYICRVVKLDSIDICSMMKKLDNVNGDYFHAHTAQSQLDYQHENEFLQRNSKIRRI